MRILIVRLVLIAATLLLPVRESRAESWRGIIPLKSARADVERLLGKPLPGSLDSYATYKLEDGEATVRYSLRKLCSEVDRCECQVPDGTVIEIAVESNVKVKFRSVRIDVAAFDRFPLVENTGIMIYRNAKVGLIYTVSVADDTVLYVQYAPSAEDCTAISKKH